MPLFITFEGIEGCGKTTQIKLLHDRLVKEGHFILLTREPGGTPVGQEIRKILLDRKNDNLAPLSELFLYAADRAQHCEEVIKPAMKQGKIVLCDRFADATTAYQEGGRELPETLVSPINEKACSDLKPDLTFLIDCPVEVGLKRARMRGATENDTQDRFERLEMLFHQRVRDRYLRIAIEEPKRVIVVDGRGTVEEIAEEIWKRLEPHLKIREVGGRR